jgi:hypothetical protein
MELTVIHVLASTRADHGGPSRSVPALCEGLDAEGVEVHLVTAVPANPSPDQAPILPEGNVRTHKIEEQTVLGRALRSPVGFTAACGLSSGRYNPTSFTTMACGCPVILWRPGWPGAPAFRWFPLREG